MFCNSCVLLRRFNTLLWLEKEIKIDEDIAYNGIFALIFACSSTPWYEALYLDEYLVFSVIFAQHVASKRQCSSKWFHENWLCFDKYTVDLVTVVEIDSKNSNQPNKKGQCAPPRRQQLYNREAVWSPRDQMINAPTVKRIVNVFADRFWKCQSTEQRRMMCSPPSRQQLYNWEAVWSSKDHLVNSTNDWTKEMINQHICQSPPLNNELLHLTIDDGIDLLFCIFLLLKNA